MIQAHGFGVQSAQDSLAPFGYEHRALRPHDVLVDIEFCGVCHTDIHQARNEWGNAIYPMVPGHEIVGTVAAVGSAAQKFALGQRVAIGTFVDSCRECDSCRNGEEVYCDRGQVIPTYNARGLDGRINFGGYADKIVADEAFVLRLPEQLDPAAAAPLLCAGITTYSPLKHFGAGPGKKVGVVGLGGLGHMALKFAHALGAEVVQFTTSPGKAEDAKRLGADSVVLTNESGWEKPLVGSLDLIIDCVAADHDVVPYLATLKRDGILCNVGIPAEPVRVPVFAMAMGRKHLTSSAAGGIRETQEMLDFCADHRIVSEIEKIGPRALEAAWQRVAKNDVKYRFVVDMKAR